MKHCIVTSLFFLLALNLPAMDERNQKYCEELHRAVRMNDMSRVFKATLDAIADCRDALNRTTMHVWAEHSNSQEIFKHLLNRSGATLGARATDGTTPLMVAVKHRKMDALVLLIAYDSEQNPVGINAQDQDGHTALHLAVEKDDASVSALLLRLGANRNLHDKEKRTPRMLARLSGKKKAESAFDTVDPYFSLAPNFLLH